jgi:hypothetical protein
MSLALSLIGADTSRDHGLRAILPHALKSIARQGVALDGFRLGSVSVPSHYADNFTEGLASYSGFEDFRRWVRAQPNAEQRYRHLLEHSDCDGFYLPVDFPSPLQRVPRSGMLGTLFPRRLSIGSSNRLLRELDELKALLRMPGDAGELPEEALDELCEEAPELPRGMWAVFRWFARESVHQNVALAFV